MSYDIKTVCSLCAHAIGYEGCVVKSSFCPNCGAKMVKETELKSTFTTYVGVPGYEATDKE
jgi:predicted RNA-binding Zn-ribbon protein involved in translation (DUF1610 family)